MDGKSINRAANVADEGRNAKAATDKHKRPKIHNAETDTDTDEEESGYTRTMDSRILIDGVSSTEQSDGGAQIEELRPLATSTQKVNVIWTDVGVMGGKEGMMEEKKRVPRSYREANLPEFKDEWAPAIHKELNAMAEHYVWEIVERPKECRALPCAWKFSVKADGTPKARLYLVGNCEPYDSFQNTYAPVTDTMTVLWLCSVAVKHRISIYQMDVTTAFLNAELDAPKFMRLSNGIQLNKTKYVCRLNKAIYGLRISPRTWYLTIERTLTDMGLQQSTHEPCLFYKHSSRGFVLLTVYVDDLLVTGTDEMGYRNCGTRLRINIQLKS